MSSSFDRDKFREDFRRTEKRDPTGREMAEARRAYGGERRYQERMERKTGKDVDEDKLAMDAALAAARPHVFDGETEADRGGGTQKKFPDIPGRDPFVIPVDNTRTGVAENKPAVQEEEEATGFTGYILLWYECVEYASSTLLTPTGVRTIPLTNAQMAVFIPDETIFDIQQPVLGKGESTSLSIVFQWFRDGRFLGATGYVGVAGGPGVAYKYPESGWTIPS